MPSAERKAVKQGFGHMVVQGEAASRLETASYGIQEGLITGIVKVAKTSPNATNRVKRLDPREISHVPLFPSYVYTPFPGTDSGSVQELGN